MAKKESNQINLYETTGPFRILLKGGQLFAGTVKGAWDDGLLVEDLNNGDCIIFKDSIAVMMEGTRPPARKEAHAVEEQTGGV